MTTHFINTNTLYILSGPSASGKSFFTNQLLSQGLTPDSIISSDTIRKNILGSSFSIDEYGLKESLNGWDIANPETFSIINNILSIRLQQKLPTIFDATNLNDESRKDYVQLAEKYGVKSHIIIFDVEENILKERLSKRRERFSLSVIDKQMNKFSKESRYPFTLVKPEDKFILLPNLIPTIKLDVLGDTHGLLDETVELLQKNNWKYINNSFINSDNERKILFLGDIVDRGPQSIDLLKAVYNTVENGNGFFVLGNHEAKLISTYQDYLSKNLLRARSLSNAQTLMNFLLLPEDERTTLINFLIKSPVYYTLWVDKEKQNTTLDNSINNFKLSFAHADNNYFNPFNFPRAFAIYGKREDDKSVDQDKLYQIGYNNKINEYVYVRGHILNTSKQDSVFSLEEDQAFKGNLVLLDIEQYIKNIAQNNWQPKHQIFEDSIMRKKTDYDFNEYIKDNVTFLKKMDELQKAGLVSDGWRKDEHGNKNPHPDGFKIFKYSKKVHFKKLWKSEPLLEKARGIAIDIAGNVIVHPFDKIYNYGEYDTGNNVLPTAKVHMVEKLNGFLGCISKHPFKNELLVSTTGSFNSDFTNYIKDFLDEKITERLLKHFKDNKQTLMFEVIHPEDKHIIEYSSSENGLWLIGARGLNLKDKPLSETELDTLAKNLELKRAKWYELEFSEVLNLLPNSTLEGYMVRDAATNETLMKIKTNYYLVTKFMGRMGPNMVEKMYKNPEQFKANHVEEEFYPIVDTITKTISKDDFSKLEQTERVDFVRNIVNDLRNSVQTNSKKITP